LIARFFDREQLSNSIAGLGIRTGGLDKVLEVGMRFIFDEPQPQLPTRLN
jgi:hypothetical protein